MRNAGDEQTLYVQGAIQHQNELIHGVGIVPSYPDKPALFSLQPTVFKGVRYFDEGQGVRVNP